MIYAHSFHPRRPEIDLFRASLTQRETKIQRVMITIWLRTCSLDQDANSLAMVEAAARITMQSQGTMTAAHFVEDVDEEGENRVHQYFRSLYLQALDEMGTGCHNSPSDRIQTTDNPNDDPNDDPTAPATASAAAHTPIAHT